MQSIPGARTGSVTFKAYEATPCGRLVPPGGHTGEAHYHDTYELLVVRAGSGTLACAGRSVTVTSGTSVLIAPGLVHSHARLSWTEAWSVQFRAADVDLVMPLVDAHVGRFDDAGHFARQFARRFGITPSAWRTHVVSGLFADGESANG